MTTTTTARVRWICDTADGIAHAYRDGWRLRSACTARRRPDLRWAHPESSRCQVCIVVIDTEAVPA
jgi:hypothetical protein